MAATTTERPGTRAQVRYARMSASKVRVVLDLVRGKHVIEASQILAFSERLAAEAIAKCLKSAVSNAGHNEEIPVDELYISACYADEGPTLKRFRPRARGRAGRIRKQTCHITIVVSRYTDEELEQLRGRSDARSAGGGRTADAAADRRRRVARSRKKDEADETPVDERPVDKKPVDETPVDEKPVDSAETVEESPLQNAEDDTTSDVTGTDETEEEN